MTPTLAIAATVSVAVSSPPPPGWLQHRQLGRQQLGRRHSVGSSLVVAGATAQGRSTTHAGDRRACSAPSSRRLRLPSSRQPPSHRHPRQRCSPQQPRRRPHRLPPLRRSPRRAARLVQQWGRRLARRARDAAAFGDGARSRRDAVRLARDSSAEPRRSLKRRSLARRMQPRRSPRSAAAAFALATLGGGGLASLGATISGAAHAPPPSHTNRRRAAVIRRHHRRQAAAPQPRRSPRLAAADASRRSHSHDLCRVVHGMRRRAAAVVYRLQCCVVMWWRAVGHKCSPFEKRLLFKLRAIAPAKESFFRSSHATGEDRDLPASRMQ